jgi:hypothetical protein
MIVAILLALACGVYGFVMFALGVAESQRGALEHSARGGDREHVGNNLH